MTQEIRNPLDETVLDMTGITAIACQDYAGAFSCGARQEGFDIVAKLEQADAFGMQAWLHNSDWLGNKDLYYEVGPMSTWEPEPADVIFGNPPCSGFSILTRGEKWQEAGLHGAEATQNQCMWDIINYGVLMQPDVIVFESVSHAATTGLPLMIALHNQLEEGTNAKWHLTLVKMNALSVGGWPDRRRFFFVASRLGPMSMPLATGIPHNLAEAIGDLRSMPISDDLDDPFSLSPTAKARRNSELAASGYWEQGKSSAEAYEIAAAAGWTGTPPDRSDMIKNPFTAQRWRWDKPARVATGAVLNSAVHPVEPRTFTHAEVGRIMGFPSQYDLRAITTMRGKGHALYGKGIPAQAGRWVMQGVREHLMNKDDGEREYPVELDIGERRYEIDVTSKWRHNQYQQSTIFEAI